MTTSAPDHPDQFLPLHPIEFRFLMVLMRGPAHGYRMVKEIEEREGGNEKIYPGNLYRRIRGLLSHGLIEEVPPPVGLDVDSRRKYYGVTRVGGAVAAAEGKRLEDLVREARALGILSGG